LLEKPFPLERLCGDPIQQIRVYLRPHGFHQVTSEAVSIGLVDMEYSDRRVQAHSTCGYTEYPDERRDEWQTKILPALQKPPLAILVKMFEDKLSRRTLIDLRAGRSRPHPENQVMIKGILQKEGFL